jgi:hypothetical protein
MILFVKFKKVVNFASTLVVFEGCFVVKFQNRKVD